MKNDIALLPLDNALANVEHKRKQLEEAQEAAEEALTQWFEHHFKELAKRFPKRQFEASSGMGSLSVDIRPGPSHREYAWIWCVDDHGSHNPVLDPLFRQWQALLDEVSDRAGLQYINFTRDVVVTGERYKES